MPNLDPLYQAYDRHIEAEQKHSPAGHVSQQQKAAAIRVAARAFGCTPEDAQRWINQRAQ